MRKIIVICHNLRSAHNVGSLLRTAEGLAVEKVYLSGYTPYPIAKHDSRLPHLARGSHKKIAKTALGAEKSLANEHVEDIFELIKRLKAAGYTICALEQSSDSVELHKFKPTTKIALVVGREVEGIEAEVLKLSDQVLEIPMFGSKESFNVAQAAAMALFYLRFT